MATGLSDTAANDLLGELSSTYTHIQLHFGDPGANGTGSVANSGTRQPVTWTTPASGAMSNSGEITWTAVATGEDYTHFSAWSDASAGTFGFSGTVTANEVTAGDTFTIPDGDLDVSIPRAS